MFSTTHMRPRSSKQNAIGSAILGSAAKIETSNPLGMDIFATASLGFRNGASLVRCCFFGNLFCECAREFGKTLVATMMHAPRINWMHDFIWGVPLVRSFADNERDQKVHVASIVVTDLQASSISQTPFDSRYLPWRSQVGVDRPFSV